MSDFELHVNLTCGSSDGVTPAHPKPTAVGLGTVTGQNASNTTDATYYNTNGETASGCTWQSPAGQQPGALNAHCHSHYLNANVYSSADGVDGSPTLATSPGSQDQGVDVYSVVSKPKAPSKEKPETAEYAVVDKTRSKQNGSRSRPENNGDAATPDVYAEVNKSGKRGNSNPFRTSEQEVEGETYAQPYSGPATSAKPPALHRPVEKGRNSSNEM